MRALKDRIRWAIYRRIDAVVVGRCNTGLRVALLRLGWPWRPEHVTDLVLGECRVRALMPVHFAVQKAKRAIDGFAYRYAPTEKYRIARAINGRDADLVAPARNVRVTWFPLVGRFLKD